MSVQHVENAYVVTLDRTTHNGILRFTKEITIWMQVDDIRDKYIFLQADAITPGGWLVYDIDEMVEFDHDFPDCLNAAKEEIKKFRDHNNGGEK